MRYSHFLFPGIFYFPNEFFAMIFVDAKKRVYRYLNLSYRIQTICEFLKTNIVVPLGVLNLYNYSAIS